MRYLLLMLILTLFYSNAEAQKNTEELLSFYQHLSKKDIKKLHQAIDRTICSNAMVKDYQKDLKNIQKIKSKIYKKHYKEYLALDLLDLWIQKLLIEYSNHSYRSYTKLNAQFYKDRYASIDRKYFIDQNLLHTHYENNFNPSSQKTDQFYKYLLVHQVNTYLGVVVYDLIDKENTAAVAHLDSTKIESYLSSRNKTIQEGHRLYYCRCNSEVKTKPLTSFASYSKNIASRLFAIYYWLGWDHVKKAAKQAGISNTDITHLTFDQIQVVLDTLVSLPEFSAYTNMLNYIATKLDQSSYYNRITKRGSQRKVVRLADDNSVIQQNLPQSFLEDKQLHLTLGELSQHRKPTQFIINFSAQINDCQHEFSKDAVTQSMVGGVFKSKKLTLVDHIYSCDCSLDKFRFISDYFETNTNIGFYGKFFTSNLFEVQENISVQQKPSKLMQYLAEALSNSSSDFNANSCYKQTDWKVRQSGFSFNNKQRKIICISNDLSTNIIHNTEDNQYLIYSGWRLNPDRYNSYHSALKAALDKMDCDCIP